MVIKRIHVRQDRIRANTKNGTREPVIAVKTYNQNLYGNEVVIFGQDGLEAARLVYSPDKPLSCGARLWVETNNVVKVT